MEGRDLARFADQLDAGVREKENSRLTLGFAQRRKE